jgi:hypothetical protein
MWKIGDIEPVRVMGAEGYPYGFNLTTEDGKPVVSFAYASRALAEAAATHLESALLAAVTASELLTRICPRSLGDGAWAGTAKGAQKGGLGLILRATTRARVRLEGACHLWRKISSRQLSIDLEADERFGWVTGRAEAS